MIVKKHLIGQTVIVPYMENTDSDGKYRQRYIRVTVNFFINVDIEPWSRLPFRRHHITSDWRVFECVDAK